MIQSLSSFPYRDRHCSGLLLSQMKEVTSPAWYCVITDEATDVINSEQLNLPLRWVDDNYKGHDDPVDLFRVPDMRADISIAVYQIYPDSMQPSFTTMPRASIRWCCQHARENTWNSNTN